MQVLVVGCTGNLGGRIVRVLLKTGATMRVLVRPGGAARASPLAAAGAGIVEADLTDPSALMEVTTGLQVLEPVMAPSSTCLLHRNRIAPIIGRFKQLRRIATRYDRIPANYIAGLYLASLSFWA